MKIEIPDELVVPIASAVDEWKYARAKHPGRYPSLHHAYGVLMEEVRELEVEVFKRRANRDHLETEALQIIAVCLRTITEVNKPKKS